MERKFFEALAFDASVSTEELTVKLDAVKKAFESSLLTIGKVGRTSEKSISASTTYSGSTLPSDSFSA